MNIGKLLIMKSCLLAPLILLLALCACHGPTPQNAAPPADVAVVPPEKNSPQAPPVGKPTAPATVELLQHADTVQGVAADLVLLITPSVALDRMTAEISGGDGLSLIPLRLDLAARDAGTPTRQRLQVTRTSAAQGYVRVLIETWQGEARRTRVVLLAVSGFESAAAPKSSAPVQTTPQGERIMSLPVEESR